MISYRIPGRKNVVVIFPVYPIRGRRRICLGDRAIALFKKAFGENFLEMGTGKILEISK